MQEVKVKHSDDIIQLGRQGENLARRILFDLTNWQALYGEGVVELIYQRPGEYSVYPVAITKDGPAAIWEITDTDTTRPGVGHCELRYYVDETLAKSKTWMTKITKAMDGEITTPPEPGQSWLDQVVQVGAEAKEAAERAEKAYKEISEFARYTIGDGLKLDEATNTISVDTAEAVEQDNTKPVTSAAVYVEIGNIEALLAAL